MAYDDDSLLGGLAPQREGMGGLLGSLGSDKMAYLAMIAKGLNPWSELDPMAMMKLAQSQKEHALSQAMNRQRLGFEERRVKLSEDEARQRHEELTGTRQADADIYGNAGQSGMGQEQIYDYMKRYPNMSKSTRDFLESRLGSIANQGKITKDIEERKAAATELGLEPGSSAYQSYLATGNPGRNQPLTATDRKEIYKSEDELPEIQGTKDALTRALELNPQTFSGLTAGARGWLGTRLPMDHIDPKAAKATAEWGSLMSQASIEKMADTLKGATTDFELKKFVEILADPSSDVDLRKRTIERMLKLAERQERIKTDRFNQLRDGSYFKPGGGSSAKPQSEAPAPEAPKRLIFDPATGDFK